MKNVTIHSARLRSELSIVRHIPNFLTSCNLFCGCLGIFFAARGFYFNAAILIWAALVFDFLDGFTARMLNVQSPIGKELDSLADVVTFGVLPSFILFGLMRDYDLPSFLPYAGFLVAVFSAFRLARFNIDERQHTEFIGLPTPANALFISSLFFADGSVLSFLLDPYILLGISIVFSLLLISPIPMFSLKFAEGGWKGNIHKIIFVFLSILLLIIFKATGLPLIIFLYIGMSLIRGGRKLHNEPGE